MRRVPSAPRPDALALVTAEGLTYASERNTAGEQVPYWTEHVAYVFDSAEIDALEAVTQELHEMSMAAARVMAVRPEILRRLQLPEPSWRAIRESMDNPGHWSLYGRFDLAYDGSGPAKLLEYNADTPAGLVEAAVSQWSWLETVRPEDDQWNMLHERLVQAWQRHAVGRHEVVHFAAGAGEPVEDWNTLTYLRDTAHEAGLRTVALTMEELGWDHSGQAFVDAAEDRIDLIFKMYPWEWMLAEEFGRHAVWSQSRTHWLEPLHKVLLGSKALLPVLWELYPDHPNLLPAYFEDERRLTDYVSKPMYGWEGAGIAIVKGGERISNDAKHTGGQQCVHQQFIHLPDFDGAHPVLGTWMVGGHAAGLGIRESSSLITDTNAHFVPHYIAAPRSSPEQVRAWLAEGDAPVQPRDGMPTPAQDAPRTSPWVESNSPPYATFRPGGTR